MEKEKKAARASPNEAAVEFGIHVKEFSPEAAQQWGYTGTEEGVIVQRVIPGSQGDEAGLQPGDLIVEIDRKPVKTMRDYHDVLQGASMKDGILVLIYRGKSSFYLAVKEE
jgi:serine protease Do